MVKAGITAAIPVSGLGEDGIKHTQRDKNRVSIQAAKTGSLCCVAARPHRPSEHAHNWSNTGNKTRWHTNEGYIPPFSSSHLDQSQGEEYLGTSSRTYPTPRRSLSSSGRGSRSWRRVDGSRLYNHYRTPSGSLYGGSPTNFIWNPLASSSHRIADSTTAESELAASPSTTVSSSKTEHFFPRPPAISNKSEITSSSLAKAPKVSPAFHSESALPSPSKANNPVFSKPLFLLPGNPARREHYEGRFPPAGRVPSLDGRFSFRRSSSSRSSSPGGSSDWSSFQGFMEVGPEARQEWLRMENGMSPNDYGWDLNRDNYDRGRGQICIEKITAGSPQSASSNGQSETCGVCSRTLTERSPWASSRVMGFHECNVVGVLVCGHTYHTECLEQITPQSSRQDPACPRCSSKKVVVKKPKAPMPTTTLRLGTVRGSSFMSRPSPRNKLSRVGVLDESVSFGKPRFLSSSPGESSP